MSSPAGPRGARLDRQLATGSTSEASTLLAARALQLASHKFRRGPGHQLRQILTNATEPALILPEWAAVGPPPHLRLRGERISQAAVPLATLAAVLDTPGSLPGHGTAMITRLLSDCTGRLYNQASRDDRRDILEKATRALTVTGTAQRAADRESSESPRLRRPPTQNG